MKFDNFEAAFRELLAKRYRPFAGAMVTYAAVPQPGAAHRLVTCRWEFRDDPAVARSAQDYGSLLLAEIWFDQPAATDRLLEMLLRGHFPDPSIADEKYFLPSGEHQLDTNVGATETKWPEWRFTASIQRNGRLEIGYSAIAKPPLRPFPTTTSAIMDWIWGTEQAVSWIGTSEPRNAGAVIILVPDTRARIRAVKWLGTNISVLAECKAPDEEFVLQGYVVIRPKRIDLPSKPLTTGSHARWEVPAQAETAYVYLVHSTGEILGLESVSPRGRGEVELAEVPTRQRSQGAGPPLYLDRLSIRNFKNIHSLDIDFHCESSLPGRWTCIAGINGSGKTAVLQAVCLALLGDRLVAELGSKLLGGLCRRVNGSYEDVELRATIGGDRELNPLVLPLSREGIDRGRLESDPAAFREMTQLWQERGQQVLASYGASRNLAPLISMLHRDKNVEVQRQMTLFDPMAQVAGIGLLLEKDGRLAAILPLLQVLLEPLLQGSPISVFPSGELLFKMNGATVSPVELPDGYRSSIAWIADLCAALHEKNPEALAKGDWPALHGIVLVDEIDLHLHPQLQRSLVPALRERLRGVQWIVTTHSPLVLSSFDKNEIVMLDSGSPDGVRTLDRQIQGFTMDEIYEWLMNTPPQSAEMDRASRAADNDPAARERLALLLAQSPDTDEDEARETLEYRRQMAMKLGFPPSSKSTEPGK